MRSGAAAGVDGHGIDDLISHLGFESAEADVGCLMVAASRRTSRPMYAERAMRRTKTLLQRLRQFESPLLGLDLSEVAEISAHARHQPALERRRRAREFLQQRFAQKRIQALPGHIGKDEVLARGEADAAIAVGIGQARCFRQLIRADSSHGDAETHGNVMELLLAGDSKMIVVAGLADVGSGDSRDITQTGNQFGTQPRQAPLLDQECQPAFRSRFSWPMIAVDANQLDHYICSFLRFDKDIQWRGYGKSSRAHLAPNEKIEAEAAIANSRHQGDVLGLAVRAVLQASGHG